MELGLDALTADPKGSCLFRIIQSKDAVPLMTPLLPRVISSELAELGSLTLEAFLNYLNPSVASPDISQDSRKLLGTGNN